MFLLLFFFVSSFLCLHPENEYFNEECSCMVKSVVKFKSTSFNTVFFSEAYLSRLWVFFFFLHTYWLKPPIAMGSFCHRLGSAPGLKYNTQDDVNYENDV